MPVVLAVTAFLLTFIGVDFFRRWSLRIGLLDIPNDRSSHSSPIPRGAGLVIATVCLVLYSAISILSTGGFYYSYLAAAILVASISWLDDLYSVPFQWRLAVHIIAAILLVSGLGYPTEIYIPGSNEFVHIGFFGAILAFLWVVGMINAFNFIDGIDGLAATQSILAGLAWFVLGLLYPFETVSTYGLILAASCLGFLIHNWNPAKVFMGDVGSTFLGVTFAALPFMASFERPESSSWLFTVAVAFVWVFIFDPGFTVLHRAMSGEKIWNPHRQHIFQRMVALGWSHKSVTLIYAVFTIAVISLAVIATFKGFWEVFSVLSILLISISIIVFSLRAKIT